MKTHIHGSGLLRRLPALVLTFTTIIMTEQAHSDMPIMPARLPPSWYVGVTIGYDVNIFSNYNVDYGSLLMLDDVPTERGNHFYYGLTADYSLSDPRDWVWSLNTAIVIRGRSFSAHASDIEVPLEADACAGTSTAAGAYNVEFDNLELDLSAILIRRLWDSRWYLGAGLGLGITGQSRKTEHISLEPEALLAGPECRIIQTDRINPREEGNAADVHSMASGETVLDPQMILSLRYVLGSLGRIVVTPSATFNIGMSELGGDEARWRRTSLSFGLELTTW